MTSRYDGYPRRDVKSFKLIIQFEFGVMDKSENVMREEKSSSCTCHKFI